MIGPATRAAITAVAQHHPDATAEHVVAVYDAYTLEQQRDTQASGRPLQLGDERSAHAIDYAATDTLITQLTITYPGVPRDTIAGIVEELRMALADPRLHGLNLLRIEYEAHQQLAAAQ